MLGLVGTNGIGKSTALKILANKEKPNLGRFDSPPDWEEILAFYRGSELQVSVMPRGVAQGKAHFFWFPRGIAELLHPHSAG